MSRAAHRRQEVARQAVLRRRRLSALVTGASSGIGEEYARLLAEQGHDLVLVARRTEQLKRVATELEGTHGITATVITADLARPDAPARVVTELDNAGIEIDVLINNAGYTMDGHYLSYHWEQHRDYLQVMAVGPAEFTHRLLPGMVRRGFGQVVNVASISGLMPASPFNALYCPSKTFLITLTRGLAGEWEDAGITFSSVCPGPVRDTAILDTRHGQTWTRFTFVLSDLRRVVELSWKAVLDHKMVQIVGPASHGVSITGRLLPTETWSRMNSRLVRFLGKEKRITTAADAGLDL
ncbi:MAG TPA: SDR family NAD(P)-dependent oxidoreductase [Pseudonocardia sp.]